MATKNKTNKSLKKRFKITGSGKVKYQKCGKRHLNAHIPSKRKRQLGRAGYVQGPLADKIIIAMGGE